MERSHLTDKTESYQLIEYTDDIDIAQKLSEWETFYNCHRPNTALKGKTPYEVLKEKLSLNNNSFSKLLLKNMGVFEKELYICSVNLS